VGLGNHYQLLDSDPAIANLIGQRSLCLLCASVVNFPKARS
jgi:hypothetical protein